MSSQKKDTTSRLAFILTAIVAALLLFGKVAAAQDQSVPKWEVFGGYSWINVNANQHAACCGLTLPVSIPLRSEPRGFGSSLTYNFNKWLGLTGDFSAHVGGPDKRVPAGNDYNFFNYSVGPKITYRGSEHFAPFLEALVGLHRLTPDGLSDDNKVGFIGGGGLDVNVAKHLALRLIQADYVVSNHHFAPISIAPGTGVSGARLQSGVVFLFGGGPPPPPPAASCSASPTEIMAGDPVKVTATTSNFPANHSISYSWSSTGGKVSGGDATTTVDTTGVAPGNYTVTANATDKKKASATCSASFTVKEPPKNPPTISCSANPATVKSGEPSAITCDCKSLDGRPVSVANWNASSGKLSGSGSNATLDTAGAASGPITVSATCSDDRGLTADGNTSVTVEAPPPVPVARKACEFDFTNKAKPARVDNAAKACLDGVADSLLQDANAKAVLVGEQGAKEKPKAPKLAEQRAVNAKAYLTSGENQKAIDASRIEPRSGAADASKVEAWIVPQGATFDESGTAPVNESKVKAQARKAAPAAASKKRSKKAAAAPSQ